MAWELRGNIMGPAGTADIPDPLVVPNEIDIGDDFRIVKQDGGGKVQARDSLGVWHDQVAWLEA